MVVRNLLPKVDLPPIDTPIGANLALLRLAHTEWLRSTGQPVAPYVDLSFALGNAKAMKRQKGAHDPAYNAELALRYELAPDGKKEAAADEVVRRYDKRRNGGEIDLTSVLRQVRRLQKDGLTWQEVLAAPPDLLNSYAVALEECQE